MSRRDIVWGGSTWISANRLLNPSIELNATNVRCSSLSFWRCLGKEKNSGSSATLLWSSKACVGAVLCSESGCRFCLSIVTGSQGRLRAENLRSFLGGSFNVTILDNMFGVAVSVSMTSVGVFLQPNENSQCHVEMYTQGTSSRVINVECSEACCRWYMWSVPEAGSIISDVSPRDLIVSDVIPPGSIVSGISPPELIIFGVIPPKPIVAGVGLPDSIIAGVSPRRSWSPSVCHTCGYQLLHFIQEKEGWTYRTIFESGEQSVLHSFSGASISLET